MDIEVCQRGHNTQVLNHWFRPMASKESQAIVAERAGQSGQCEHGTETFWQTRSRNQKELKRWTADLQNKALMSTPPTVITV